MRRARNSSDFALASAASRSASARASGQDVGGLALGFALLAVVLVEQGLRFVLEAARLVELGPDTGAALVERVEDHLVRAEIDQHAKEDDEGDGHPEFGSPHELCLSV